MNIDDYVKQCEQNLKKLENIENYEKCQEMYELINSIKNKDVEKYIYLTFDIDGLLEAGFFKSKPTSKEAENKINIFFGLDNIFEYSLIGGGMFCSFHRNLKILEQ